MLSPIQAQWMIFSKLIAKVPVQVAAACCTVASLVHLECSGNYAKNTSELTIMRFVFRDKNILHHEELFKLISYQYIHIDA